MKHKYYHWVATILFVSFFHLSFSQKIPVTIQGQITDNKSNKPISKVNIFLSGTTIGATTDAQGKYTIQDSIPIGNYTLVFSHINYQIVTKSLVISNQRKFDFNIKLIFQKNTLDEVTVKSKRDKIWRLRFKRFRQEFLGSSSLARRCKIVNPWVLDFKEKNDSLFASAIKELVIENPTLGYRVYCNLKNTNYLGLYRFEVLKPKNKKQKRKWLKARIRSFKGSFQHFACALMYNRMSKEGFFMSYSDQSPATTPDIKTKPLEANQILREDRIEFPHYIKITHSEREPNEYIQWLTKQDRSLHPIKRANEAVPQISWIKIQGKSLKLSDLGIIMDDPYKLKTSGFWAWHRVGNMLPSNFIPDELMQAIKLSKVQTVKQLAAYTKRRPQEKVYLHQSKGFYFVRDTMWLSSYIVDAQTHKPSELSKILYVELIDEHQQIKKQLRLPNRKGKAQGLFILEDFLKPGKYRLRAYTKLMEGADPVYFFNQFFEIGDSGLDPVKVKLNYKNQIKNQDEKVAYELQLLGDNKKLLAGKKVDVLVKTGQKTYKKITLKTDAQGRIKGAIPLDAKEKSPYLEIAVKSPKSANKEQVFQKSFFIPIKQYKTNVRFLPEGGELIAGFSNQIAFKAVNAQGWGVDAKGYIINDKKEKVAEFQSMHKGMGKFSFVPNRKQRYTAIITHADGSEQKVDFPQVTEKGFILTINQESEDFLAIKIRTNLGKKEKYTLIGHSRGKPVYTYSGELQKKNFFTLKIAKNTLPAGMVLFTLFDNSFQPRCERLVFINNNNLQVKLEANKSSYSPQEKVEISLKVKSQKFDTIPTSLSMAVVSEELSEPVENQTNILSNLLLTSDIKGFIENPGFYFKNKKASTRQALDLLMMTQGWRRFSWNKVLKDTVKSPKINLEQGFTISGKVTTRSGKPIANGTVTVLAPKVNLSRFTTTDANGRFSFKHLYLFNSTKVLVKAANAKGKARNVKVELDENHQPFKIHAYQPYNQFFAQANGKSSSIKDYLASKRKNKEILEEITVSAKKLPKKLPKRRMGQLHQQANHSLNLENLEYYGATNLLEYLKSKVPGVRVIDGQDTQTDANGNIIGGTLKPMILIRNSNSDFVDFKPAPATQFDDPIEGSTTASNIEPLYMLDGVPVDIYTLQAIPMENIAQVDILSASRSSIYGTNARNGAVAVFTRKGYIPPRPSSRKGIIDFVFREGYNETREFYVPPYHQDKFSKKNLPDYRTTVYWNPNIQTKNGTAKVSFYTPDNPGVYRVIVEGLSQQGEVTRKEFFYEVKKKE